MTWVTEVQSGAAVASQGVVLRFGDSDTFIEYVEVVVDGSPVDADLIAEISVLEFFTGVGGGDGAETVEVFGLLDGSVLGEFFVEEEEEVGFGEFVPDRWVVCLIESTTCAQVCARGVVKIVPVVRFEGIEAEF